VVCCKLQAALAREIAEVEEQISKDQLEKGGKGSMSPVPMSSTDDETVNPLDSEWIVD